MQFYLGPMSLNVLIAALDFHDTQQLPLTFIPSRRQIDFQGGYVAKMTMKELRDVVGDHVHIERDHAGPGQGAEYDSGWESLAEDVKYANIIHLDPWKALPAYEEGLEWTVAAIVMCLLWNPNIRFEVGTEESIRPFTVTELDQFLADLQDRLNPQQFAAIQFVVVQCGTALKEGQNTGAFDAEKLRRMLDVVERYGKTAKEHNGDWISAETVAAKAAIGLRHINIAPELGEIESRTIYALMNDEDKEAFFDLCWKSRKWEKWVSADYDPQANKADLVRICGHYVFSDPAFEALKRRYPSADTDAQQAIQMRLNELYSL
jgi:hypothetical protein